MLQDFGVKGYDRVYLRRWEPTRQRRRIHNFGLTANRRLVTPKLEPQIPESGHPEPKTNSPRTV